MGSPIARTHLVVWRSTTVDCGRTCVITLGAQQTLVWLVVNLGFLLPIPAGPSVAMESEAFVCSIAIYKMMFPQACCDKYFYKKIK